MNKIKVTFYNDVSIVRNNDYKKASTASSAGFASGGIYFTSSNDITNGNPAHIVHGNNGFIYTLGSYIIPNSDIKTYNLTYVIGSDFKMDDTTYFISDISADPFQKTLTVTKSKITLGNSFVNGINTIQNFLNNLRSKSGKGNLITVGGKYKVWFELSDTGVFELQTEDMKTGTFTNTFIDNSGKEHDDISDVFEIATENSGYFYIQAPSTITNITLTINTPGSFKDGKSIESKILDDDKKTAKITIPNGGWNATSETDKTTFTFTAEIKTQGDVEQNIGASQDTFTFTLKRIESPFNFVSQTSNRFNASTEQSSKIYLNNTNLLTRNFDVTSLDITYTPKDYLSFYKDIKSIFDSYFVVNTYYLPTENEKIEFNYSDNTIVNNAYYAYLTNTPKAAEIQLSGAGKWVLQLQPGENTNYVHTYSFCYGTQKNPLDLYKPDDVGAQTFSYWFLKDTKEPIENITFGSDLFTDYSLRLYAKWEVKSDTINITGENYSDERVTTDMSLKTFSLTASANINGTTFTWEVSEGTDYIQIAEIDDNTSSCEFSLLKWMRENATCKIKVTAKVGTITTTTQEIIVKVNPVSQTITVEPTALNWDGSNLNTQTVTISGVKTTLSYTPNENFELSLTKEKDVYTLSVTPKDYNIDSTITVTASENEIYSNETKTIDVNVSAPSIKYYWYVGQTEPNSSNYTTLASQVTSYPTTHDYTVEKRGYIYILLSNSKTLSKIIDTSNGFDINYSETTSTVSGYKLYKTAAVAAGCPLRFTIS